MLDKYLEVLTKYNVMSYAHKDTNGEFNVVIGPGIPSIGSEPQPGGWKSPTNLDDPDKLFRVDKEPSI